MPQHAETRSGSAPHRAHYDPGITIRGSGPPLVLVPGLDGTGLLFYRQIPLLAAHYRVATWALRDDAPSMDVLVDDLRAVVDAVSIGHGRALVVGESFGGTLALSFALAHPDRTTGVVAINSFARVLPQPYLLLALAGIRAMPWGAMRLVRHLTAWRLHSPHTHRAEVRRFLSLTKATTRSGYLSRLRILRAYDVRERLATLAVPALFVASDRDHLIPSLREATRMAARVPDGALHVLRGHGHACLIAPGVDLAEILHDWQAGRRHRTAVDARSGAAAER